MLRPLSRTTRDNPFRQDALPWWLRSFLALQGLVLLGLLITAACLTPSPKGFGTHQQLGLPPCTITRLFKIRCPSCGMTTSWAHAVRGQLPSAVKANTGGALLALVAMAAGPWSLATATRGIWFGGRPRNDVVIIVSLLVIGVTLLDWVCRLLLE